jgi:tetratricopeptide (TPR) repeat protein
VHKRAEGRWACAWRGVEAPPRTTYFLGMLLLSFLILNYTRECFAQEASGATLPPASKEAQVPRPVGKSTKAIDLLLAQVAKDPQAPGIDAKLGKAYFENRQFNESIAHLKPALAQNPEDLESQQILALSYYAIGHFGEALPWLEKLDGRLPQAETDGNYLLGVCYLMTQRRDDARKIFARMFSLEPDTAMAYFMLGKMMVRQKMEEQAVGEIETALKLDPRLPMAHFLLGEIALYKKDAEAAVGEFRKELAINPSVWLVYWRLGDAYVKAEKYEDAEKALKKSIWLNETSTGPYILLGEIELKKGDGQLASQYLERALKLDPQNYYVHYFLGKAYQSTGRAEEANKHFEISRSLRVEKRKDEQSTFQQPQ